MDKKYELLESFHKKEIDAEDLTLAVWKEAQKELVTKLETEAIGKSEDFNLAVEYLRNLIKK